jgi:hypothetical protein
VETYNFESIFLPEIKSYDVLAQGQAFVDAHELIFREIHASEFPEKFNVRVGFR